MIVKIEPTIYNTEKYFDILDQILFLFYSGKHNWYIKNVEEIIDSAWMKIEVAGTWKKAKVDDLIKTAVKSVYIDKNKQKYIITVLNSDNETAYSYNPDNALKLLNDSLYIIVENSNSDRIFIETIAKAFNKVKITEAISEEWIKFDTEGGSGGIPRRIDFHFKKTYKPRLYILVDSDRENPSDNHHAEKIVEKCKEKELIEEEDYHILFKRAIENYIPIEAFKEISNLFENVPKKVKNVIDAYKSLKSEQKDYYNLKSGFKKDKKKQGKLPEKQKELFDNINSKDILFQKLSEGFSVDRFKPNDLHILFNQSDTITKQTLIDRCKRKPNELENIMKQMSGLL